MGSSVARRAHSVRHQSFDAIALEEAVRISERRLDPVEVVAVGIGGEGYDQQMRTALAMGREAVHVECSNAGSVERSPIAVAVVERNDRS